MARIGVMAQDVLNILGGQSCQCNFNLSNMINYPINHSLFRVDFIWDSEYCNIMIMAKCCLFLVLNVVL